MVLTIVFNAGFIDMVKITSENSSIEKIPSQLSAMVGLIRRTGKRRKVRRIQLETAINPGS